ncbi:hypothetical protein Hypma_013543 [Hypsizygus marmoreus]|uniref:Uncharacterized protein n=1 Tax=Hypsizygus marmoreus TaxID=39966 RepID=A0A369JFN1_HYPMA|nr:hypothetical protein Hypma_013543 [Hypsizygus marmoreus]
MESAGIIVLGSRTGYRVLYNALSTWFCSLSVMPYTTAVTNDLAKNTETYMTRMLNTEVNPLFRNLRDFPHSSDLIAYDQVQFHITIVDQNMPQYTVESGLAATLLDNQPASA